MSKMKLVFTDYKENWDEFTVHIVVKAKLNDVELEAISMDMSHNRATTSVIAHNACKQMQDIVEQSIKRLGMQPSDYDWDMDKMLEMFDVQLHLKFRMECTKYEIPFNHLKCA